MFGINIHGEVILNLSLSTTAERPIFRARVSTFNHENSFTVFITFHYFTLFCYMGVDRVQIHENVRTLIDILLRIYGMWYTKYFEISLTLLTILGQHDYIGKVCNKICEGHIDRYQHVFNEK